MSESQISALSSSRACFACFKPVLEAAAARDECSHIFHPDCIILHSLTWTSQKARVFCPICYPRGRDVSEKDAVALGTEISILVDEVLTGASYVASQSCNKEGREMKSMNYRLWQQMILGPIDALTLLLIKVARDHVQASSVAKTTAVAYDQCLQIIQAVKSLRAWTVSTRLALYEVEKQSTEAAESDLRCCAFEIAGLIKFIHNTHEALCQDGMPWPEDVQQSLQPQSIPSDVV